VQPPPGVRAVLERLSSVAEPVGRGARWPLTPPDGFGHDDFWPGWCHGAAGYVFVWNLARVVYADERFAELAERAAWLTAPPSPITSLCCGAAGQAYAALNHFRSTGNERWLTRATVIARFAAEHGELAGDATSPLSLYKGHVGLALLAAELEDPERAAMPLFEFEPAAPPSPSALS
jgi:serine/threonine-protein kinase